MHYVRLQLRPLRQREIFPVFEFRHALLITRRLMYFWNLHANITFGSVRFSYLYYHSRRHIIVVAYIYSIHTYTIYILLLIHTSTPALKLKLNGKYLAKMILPERKVMCKYNKQCRTHSDTRDLTIHIVRILILHRHTRHNYTNTHDTNVFDIRGTFEYKSNTIRPTVKDYIDSEAKHTDGLQLECVYSKNKDSIINAYK